MKWDSKYINLCETKASQKCDIDKMRWRDTRVRGSLTDLSNSFWQNIVLRLNKL